MRAEPERTAVIDLTYRCNSPCRYCRWGSSRTAERRDLPLDAVLLPVQTLRALGTSRIVISGGEPLLYPHLANVLRYYAQYVEERVVITNGLLLDDAKRRVFHSAGATGFAFSIDSVSPIRYFATRGWPAKQLTRVLKNLQCAAGVENLEVSINAVVSRATAEWASVSELLAFGSSLELDQVKFQPVFDDGYLSTSAPWLALNGSDVPNLLGIADEVGRCEGLNTNPPGFWRDLAAMAAARQLQARHCALGENTVLVVGGRLSRCYWVSSADVGTVHSLREDLREHESIVELTAAKSRCQVDSRCFCLQGLSHEWGERE